MKMVPSDITGVMILVCHSNGTLKEIINMVKVNNMSINISIMLETGGIIYFKIE